jgi:adenosylcobinamide-GDP ribazoletransferase
MLTCVPVRPVLEVTPATALGALLAAPAAAAPLGVVVGLACWAGGHASLPPLAVAFLALGLLALGSRAMHLDGLSDVADGLAASYDRERSLAVMRTGTSGPAGTVAVVLVLALQTAGLVGMLARRGGWRTAVLAAVCVCASRAALAACCMRGVPPARPGGLGRTYAQTVPRLAAVAVWLLAAVGLGAVGSWAGLPWWRGPLATVVALIVVVAVLARTATRFGGVTGDVFGAAVESALAALLVTLA